ncbi:hypothetical protein GIB67_014982 [Kingdonia uniflora]|uniref:PAZ domain-containing protein n=1 Tax=Kingdonia uniflora TaxID=39325 RepID=A0A7J7MU25_9MAGN|nr:hypothetical protein GIB67_014982 [Kingdonia uniflora]
MKAIMTFISRKSDPNGVEDATTYYGVVKEILELNYFDFQQTVFYCDWVQIEDKDEYDVPTYMKGKVLARAQRLWCDRNSKYQKFNYDPYPNDEVRKTKCPKRFRPEDWERLFDLQREPRVITRRETGKAARKAMKRPHTSGRRGSGRTAERLRKKNPKVPILRTDVYLAAHTRADGSSLTPELDVELEKIRNICIAEPETINLDIDNDPVVQEKTVRFTLEEDLVHVKDKLTIMDEKLLSLATGRQGRAVFKLLEVDDKIKKTLRGMKVEVTHHGNLKNMRRKYRVIGLTVQATRDLTFSADESGTIKSVVQYFQEAYDIVLQHPHRPCLQVGNQQRLNYLPMEVCRIVEGQRYSKSLSEKQVTSLLKVTCQRPYDREHDIVKAVHHNDYDEDPYAKEFGLKISNKLTTIEARILPTPVSYNKGLLLEGYYYPCSFRLKKAFRKIHVRLTMELEKKFSGKMRNGTSGQSSTGSNCDPHRETQEPTGRLGGSDLIQI